MKSDDGHNVPPELVTNVSGKHGEETVKTAFGSRLRYPNPFQPAGIEFILPSDALVSLVIFDDSGREVKTLINNEQYKAGAHQLSFDAGDFGTGKYFYRLSAEIRGEESGSVVSGQTFVDVKRL